MLRALASTAALLLFAVAWVGGTGWRTYAELRDAGARGSAAALVNHVDAKGVMLAWLARYPTEIYAGVSPQNLAQITRSSRDLSLQGIVRSIQRADDGPRQPLLQRLITPNPRSEDIELLAVLLEAVASGRLLFDCVADPICWQQVAQDIDRAGGIRGATVAGWRLDGLLTVWLDMDVRVRGSRSPERWAVKLDFGGLRWSVTDIVMPAPYVERLATASAAAAVRRAAERAGRE